MTDEDQLAENAKAKLAMSADDADEVASGRCWFVKLAAKNVYEIYHRNE
jgi:hypothetical protein